MSKTKVCFVLDDSASISSAGITKDVHTAFNRYLKDISDDAIQSGDDVTVSLFLFGEEITREFYDVQAKHIRELAKYSPNQGRTRLFEATAKAIRAMEDLDVQGSRNGDEVAVLIYVVTDGENNDFRYSATQLRNDIVRVQRKGNYTLAFMLPPGSKRGFCRDFGISEGNVAEWETSRAGVQKAADVQVAGIKKYLVARRAGQMSTDSFYADLSHVSPAQIRGALEDISNKCRVLSVWKRVRIDDFCNDHLGGYIKGAGFYQLVKSEKAVQDYKQILIMEKGKTAIYAGDAARQMLGLPDHSVKLIPGDHANFEIFVQSTSMNRMLDANTKMIYYADAGK